MRTVEHDGTEACVDASLCALKCTVVEVKSYRNGDSQIFDHTLNHSYDGGVAAHILSCTLGHTKNYGSLKLLRGLKDRLCPFEVVDVELTDGIMTVSRLVKHFLC